MLDVADVQLHTGFEGRIFARGYLPESGHAGNHFEALFMPGTVLFHVFERVGTRADEAHVAFEDVPQLRQLVQTVFAKKSAYRRDARIVGHLEKRALPLIEMEKRVAQPLCARHHCPKLVTGKEHASFPNAQRGINRWALRLESHRQSDHKHQRPEQENSDRSEQKIQNPFGKSVERRNTLPVRPRIASGFVGSAGRSFCKSVDDGLQALCFRQIAGRL